MATKEETVILNVQINQADAEKKLVTTEKNVLNLKKQQVDLNKAYKDGKITQDAYVRSNLQIQNALKTENEQKKTLNKLLNDETAARNKASESITRSAAATQKFKSGTSDIAKSFSAATNEIKPFGISVESATGSLAKYATGAGAVVGILGALGAAYAMSADGARDLQYAQDLLSASLEIATDEFGEFISSLTGAGEGEGVFSQLAFAFLSQIDMGLATASIAKASAKETLRDLEISRALAQAFAKEDERRAENARRIRDDESKDLNERLAQVEKIDETLSRSANRSIIVIQAQINAIKESTTNYDKNRNAQLQVAQLTAEINDKEEEINGKLTENVTARRNILKLIKEQAELEGALSAANARISGVQTVTGKINAITPDKSDPEKMGETPEQVVAAQDTQKLITQAAIDGGQIRLSINEKMNADILKMNKDMSDRDLKQRQKALAQKHQAELAFADAYADILGSMSSLFDQNSEEYKAIATAQALISTYGAATKAYEAAFLPVPTVASPALGVAFAAAAIAQGLANVAAIHGIQFAEGGFTGVGGKYDVAGLVHKGEYVVPQHVVYNPVAKPHLQAMENLRRTGYADGGFVNETSINDTQLALITANAIRNMPPPVVSVKEITRKQNQINARETTSTL